MRTLDFAILKICLNISIFIFVTSVLKLLNFLLSFAFHRAVLILKDIKHTHTHTFTKHYL